MKYLTLLLVLFSCELPISNNLARQTKATSNSPVMFNSQTKNAAISKLILSSNFINESQPIGTLISILSASETDLINILTYYLTDTSEYDNESLTLNSDALKSNQTFDYESQNIFFNTISCQKPIWSTNIFLHNTTN